MSPCAGLDVLAPLQRDFLVFFFFLGGVVSSVLFSEPWNFVFFFHQDESTSWTPIRPGDCGLLFLLGAELCEATR